jgi:hypothetical protein
MRARGWGAAVAAVALGLGLLGGAAGAAGDEGSVSITGVTVDGSAATVSGTASFPDVTVPHQVRVGPATQSFAEPALSGPLGIALTGATITSLPEGEGVRFTWELESLPPVVPPEVVRYTWAFNVGGDEFQLQAKTSNLVGTTTVDEPQGHLTNVGSDYFQLRGRCTPAYMGTTVAGCYHLAFLEGEFDSAAGTVTVDLPYGTPGTDKLVPGASIVASESAGMSIAAAVQAGVSNTSTANYINGWRTYLLGEKVEVGVGRANGTGIVWSPAELAEDGSFTGTATGLSATLTTVYARACAGAVCAMSAVTP